MVSSVKLRWAAGLTVCALVAVVAATFVATSPAGEVRRSDLSISFIQASFSSADRATTYSLLPPKDDWPGGAKLTYGWELKMKAVDPAVGIDPGCNNKGVLVGHDTTFVWKHGNKGDSVRDDGCDHQIQGKYGHQGEISVYVDDGHGWSCLAFYKGSESSNLGSVVDGVATLPTCSDRCEHDGKAAAYWQGEAKRLRLELDALKKEVEQAKAALKNAQNVFYKLDAIVHGAEELPEAKADVANAQKKLDELTEKVKATQAKYENAFQLYESYDDDYETCRGTRRFGQRLAAGAPTWVPQAAAGCTAEGEAAERARGESAAYALLLRLATPDLRPLARRLGAHAAKLPKARPALNASRAALTRITAHIARLRVAAAANARTLKAANAALAACQAKS